MASTEHDPDVDFYEISLEEKVGHGSYGVVYKAIWRNQPVAVKEFGASAEKKAIETEVKQLSRVKHANIIALYGISSHQQATYLIMEYAEGGSLHNFLHGKVQLPYSPAHALSWARQCADGVAYLHAMTPKALIHRDLKPLNLLLTNKGRSLKICDFGTVADKSTLMTNNRGSAAWMAPEVFEGRVYTEKCDIFSWAIVLWEVLSRKQPFKDIDNALSIMWKIHKGERPPLLTLCPKGINDLMTACWKTKPEERPSMSYVVQVMNNIIKDFKGADKALEYTFVNQQIVTKDSECTNNLSLSLSDLSVNAFTQLTPTNVVSTATTPTTNTSNALTPTNASNNIDNNTVFQTPAAHIVSTSRWDAIPEEEDNECRTNDSFNLTSSAETNNRLETIRNGMMQMANTRLPELTLQVEPNDFDLRHSNSNSSNTAAKGDGKEHLTVTDTKPLVVATPSATGAGSNTANGSGTSSSNVNRHADVSNNNNDIIDNADDNDEDESDGTVQSMAELLDAELQPEQPIPNNAESEAIYREHRHMAKEYLRVDTRIYYAQVYKQEIMAKLDPADRELKQELLLKLKDRDGLKSLYNNLQQQLAARLPAHQVMPDVRLPDGNNAEQLLNNSGVGGGNSSNNGAEVMADGGWVVIGPPPSNS